MKAIQYKGVNELLYTKDHPLMIQWSSFFSERFKNQGIFESFRTKVNLPSVTASKVTGAYWFQFSDLMPWVLCMATAKLSSNKMRHYTVQAAFEELGMREENEIHPELFLKATEVVDVSKEEQSRFSQGKRLKKALLFLKKSVMGLKTDAEILGLLLGLEILAEENIELLFSCLCHDEGFREPLNRTKFFQFHNIVESEHIRLGVSNFLRFCLTEKEKKVFIKGFDKGLLFWDKFWSSLGHTIQKVETYAQ